MNPALIKLNNEQNGIISVDFISSIWTFANFSRPHFIFIYIYITYIHKKNLENQSFSFFTKECVYIIPLYYRIKNIPNRFFSRKCPPQIRLSLEVKIERPTDMEHYYSMNYIHVTRQKSFKYATRPYVGLHFHFSERIFQNLQLALATSVACKV